MADASEQAAERLAAIQRQAQSLAEQPRRSAPQATPITDSPVLRVIANITLGSFVLLVLTGLHLFFYYRPLSRLSGQSQLAGGTSGVGGLSELSRQLHVLAAWLVAAGMVVGMVAWVWPRRRPLAAVALPVAGLFGAAGIVGGNAAWSDVAIAASAVSDPTGFVSLFGDQVESISRNGEVVSATGLMMWVAVHLGLAITAAAVVLAVRHVAQKD